MVNVYNQMERSLNFLINNIGKRVEIRDHKHKLYSIFLVSIVMILMSVSILYASPDAYIQNFGSNIFL